MQPNKPDIRPKKPTHTTLACFAVKEEAAPYQEHPRRHSSVEILITGMGAKNAEESLRKSLAIHRPLIVLSCGFAGGINPYLDRGTVIFSGGDARIESRMLAAGAVHGNVGNVEKVVTTSAEKKKLFETIKADAVDMESLALQNVCAEEKILFAVVRVIMDDANEDLPVDFNELMTPELTINRFKLATMLVKAPKNIFVLKKFRKERVEPAAEALTKLLVNVLPV
jgi:nucleoside phosphorylase